MSQLVELVDQGIALASTGDRADLRRRLEQTKERLLDPSVRVIVVGEFKQGKSQLVNALVNAPICPVDDDIATAVPTSVRYGEHPAAFVLSQRSSSGTIETGGSGGARRGRGARSSPTTCRSVRRPIATAR